MSRASSSIGGPWRAQVARERPPAPASGPMHLLGDALTQPGLLHRLDLRGWELLVSQARNAELLGQLHRVLARRGLLELAPPQARRHLDIAERIAQRHREAIHHELHNLQEALQPLGIPVILLKGAAYAAQGLEAGIGRVCNDIDILVPRGMLPAVERDLRHAGWLSTHTTPYDERYYRNWSHEIPPLGHKHRATTLDVHHALVPPTTGIRPDLELLFDASRPLGSPWPALRTLSPADMVMHSATHLFFGEFNKGLRDLYDIHCLVTEFNRNDDFLPWLLERSAAMGLLLPVRDALRHAERVFGTHLPQPTRQQVHAPFMGPWPQRWRDALFERVLQAPHPSLDSRGHRLAATAAFVRSHWLRMPLPLLIYHLGHKLFTPR